MVLSKAELQERKHYIGSSEAKIIAGGNLEEWRKLIEEKRGNIEKVFPKATRYKMDLGSYLETFIIDTFVNVTGINVDTRGMGKTILAENIPMHSTFDGLTDPSE